MLLSFLCAMTFSACALLDRNPQSEEERRTVEHLVGTPATTSENLPIRTLSVTVLLGEHEELVDVQYQFIGASELLREQVGVVLDVTYVRKPSWTPRSFFDLAFKTTRAGYKHPNANLLVGIGLLPKEEEWSCHVGSNGVKRCVAGVYLGNGTIIFRRLDPSIIAHEIGHAFIGLGHSPTGVMTSGTESRYFSVADRKRFLKKKWKTTRSQVAGSYEQ